MVLVEDQDFKRNCLYILINWINFPILKYNTKAVLLFSLLLEVRPWTKLRNWQDVSLGEPLLPHLEEAYFYGIGPDLSYVVD